VWGWFRTKRRTAEQELAALASNVAATLLSAGATDELNRRLAVVSSFGATIGALTQCLPQYPVERDALAVFVVENAANPDRWAEVEGLVEFAIQRVKEAPAEKRAAISLFFFMPRWVSDGAI